MCKEAVMVGVDVEGAEGGEELGDNGLGIEGIEVNHWTASVIGHGKLELGSRTQHDGNVGEEEAQVGDISFAAAERGHVGGSVMASWSYGNSPSEIQ